MVQEKGRSSNRSVSSLSLSNTQKTACSGSTPTPLLCLNQVQWMFHVCLQHLNKEPMRIGFAMVPGTIRSHFYLNSLKILKGRKHSLNHMGTYSEVPCSFSSTK